MQLRWPDQRQENGHFVEEMGEGLHKVPDKLDFVDNSVEFDFVFEC